MAIEGSPEGPQRENELVMYDKVIFSYSAGLNPRIQEAADRLEVPYIRLVARALEDASPIDLTDTISSYLDGLDKQDHVVPPEAV